MKKINNKAMTTVEILVCFVLVAIVSTSMLNVVLNYNTRQGIESLNADVKRYKNNVTYMIQNDIIKKHLSNVIPSVVVRDNEAYAYDKYNMDKNRITIATTPDGKYETRTIRMIFNKPSVSEKTLIIAKSTGKEEVPDYIEYIDNDNKKVRYELSNFGGYTTKDDDFGETEKHLRHLRFGNVTTEVKFAILIIDIEIFHHELGSKNHILIKAPINQ